LVGISNSPVLNIFNDPIFEIIGIILTILAKTIKAVFIRIAKPILSKLSLQRFLLPILKAISKNGLMKKTSRIISTMGILINYAHVSLQILFTGIQLLLFARLMDKVLPLLRPLITFSRKIETSSVDISFRGKGKGKGKSKTEELPDKNSSMDETIRLIDNRKLSDKDVIIKKNTKKTSYRITVYEEGYNKNIKYDTVYVRLSPKKVEKFAERVILAKRAVALNTKDISFTKSLVKMYNYDNPKFEKLHTKVGFFRPLPLVKEAYQSTAPAAVPAAAA